VTKRAHSKDRLKRALLTKTSEYQVVGFTWQENYFSYGKLTQAGMNHINNLLESVGFSAALFAAQPGAQPPTRLTPRAYGEPDPPSYESNPNSILTRPTPGDMAAVYGVEGNDEDETPPGLVRGFSTAVDANVLFVGGAADQVPAELSPAQRLKQRIIQGDTDKKPEEPPAHWGAYGKRRSTKNHAKQTTGTSPSQRGKKAKEKIEKKKACTAADDALLRQFELEKAEITKVVANIVTTTRMYGCIRPTQAPALVAMIHEHFIEHNKPLTKVAIRRCVHIDYPRTLGVLCCAPRLVINAEYIKAMQGPDKKAVNGKKQTARPIRK
jgi:hypothetical protein